MKKLITYAGVLLLTIAALPAFAQYQINGNASDLGSGCYQLTPNTGAQVGSVWNTSLINLNQPFDFTFNVFLGCDDAGADGICFGLQPLGTTIGTSGNGMGLGGISPSLGIYIDTYQNSTPDSDPAYDHISINANGDVSHTSANNLAGPVQASSTSADIEDCAYHTLEVIWDPASQTYEAYFDGVPRISYTGDIINDIFGGNPNVYWGFTGATGGLSNQQSFCLIAAANFMAGNVCVGNPTVFTDLSSSGNPITSWSWDFGDGSPVFSGSSPATYQNPVHTYAAAGSYTVLETINNTGGASSTISHVITVVSPPVVTASGGTTICSNQTINLNGTVSGSSNVSLGFTSSGSVAIPDNGVGTGWTGTGGSFATSNIPVSGLNPGWSLSSISFNITHTFDGDLIAYLYDPCGNSIQLISSDGGSGDNFTNTTFSPSATTAIGSGTAPFNGTFVPSGGTAAWNAFLSATAGCASANGTWSLHVGDKAGADVGTVVNWSLNFTNPSSPTFSWSPSAGMTNPSTLTPTVGPDTTTTYTLTATNSMGCVSTATTTVTVIPAPALVITSPAAVCAPGSVDITEAAVTSGSTGGGSLSYYSDSTATTPLSSPNAITTSGTYYIQSTAGACSDIKPVNVTISPAPVLSIHNPPAICSPGSVDITDPSVTAGSTGSGTLSYYTDSAATTPLSSPAAVTSGGTYYILSQVGTCSDLQPVTVTINPAPSLVITDPAPICGPGSVDITASSVTAGSTGGGALSYYADSATTIPLSSPNAITTSGTYYILSQTAFCSDTKPVVVTISSMPSLVVNNPAAVCGPASIDLTDPSVTAGSTGGGTLSYYTDAAATNPLAAPNAVTTSGTYYIRAANGACSDIQPVTVSITTTPSLVITDPAPACSPATIDITAASVTAGSTGGGTLSYYSDAAGTVALASPNAVSTSGTYYVASTNGSCRDIEPVTVTINTTPVLAITNPAPVCGPATVDITAPAVTAGSTGGGTLAYYSDAAGTVALASPNAVSTSGTYYVASTNGSCRDIEPVTVTINTTPVLTITNPAPVCGPATVDLTAPAVTAGSTGGGTLSYYSDAAATSPLSAPSAITGSGTYYIESSNGSCTDIEPVVVTINPTPSLTITDPAPVCGSGSINLTASAVTAGSTGGGTLSYWTDAAATNPLSSPAAVTSSGTYYIESSSGACHDIAPVHAQINPAPVADAGAAAAIGCSSNSLVLDGSGSSSGSSITYSWSTTDGHIVSNGTGTAPTIDQPGTYMITVTNTSTSCSSTSSVLITGGSAPVASFTATPSGGQAPLPVNFTNNSTNALGYVWTFGDGSSSVQTDPNTVFTTPGSYQVCLVAVNTTCADTSCMRIEVGAEFAFELPNVFTPNGDGHNDVFKPVVAEGVTSFEGVIYDRWGLKLYEWNSANGGWNGKAKSGAMSPDGTYYYIIKASGADAKVHEYTGYVTLLSE